MLKKFSTKPDHLYELVALELYGSKRPAAALRQEVVYWLTPRKRANIAKGLHNFPHTQGITLMDWIDREKFRKWKHYVRHQGDPEAYPDRVAVHALCAVLDISILLFTCNSRLPNTAAVKKQVLRIGNTDTRRRQPLLMLCSYADFCYAPLIVRHREDDLMGSSEEYSAS